MQVPHDDDVVLLCKARMASLKMSQQALVILPAQHASVLEQQVLEPAKRNSLSDRQLSEFRKTASAVGKAPWGLTRAEEYLRQWCANNEAETWPKPPAMIVDITKKLEPKLDTELNLTTVGEKPMVCGLPRDEVFRQFAPGSPRRVIVNADLPVRKRVRKPEGPEEELKVSGQPAKRTRHPDYKHHYRKD